MKKVTRILGLCALVALATVSCKKNENTNEGGKSFFATINQPTNGAKTHIGDEDYLYWDAEEQIKVYTENGEAYGIFTNKSGAVKKAEFTGEIVESDKYVAFYPVTNIGDQIILKVNDEQTYVADNFGKGEYPMAAFNQGDDFLFRSPCAVVCLPLKGNAKINTITLSDKGGKMLAGNFNVNLDGFDPATWSTYGYNGTSASVVLNCNQQLTSTATNFYFVVAAPETVFADGIQFEIEYEGGSKTLTSTNDNALEAETILTMSPVEINKPAPEIGYFRVSPDDKKVTFAPGNLWYDASNTGKEWRLENHQWDSHVTVNPDALGMFCWSNENNNYGRDMQDGDGNYIFGTTFVDWGGLSICKPGSTTEQYDQNEWRTLKGSSTDYMNEIDYLLYWREQVYGKQLHTQKEVHGVQCLVLAPDNYTGNIENDSWDELEARGAVAIPLTGQYETLYHHGEEYYYGQGEKVWLWGNGISDSQLGVCFYYYNNMDPEEGWRNSATQTFRFAVRLVKDVVVR